MTRHARSMSHSDEHTAESDDKDMIIVSKSCPLLSQSLYNYFVNLAL